MADRENRDQKLFDQIATAYARKDTVLSSVIARTYRVECAVRRILERQQSLGTVVDVGCGVGAPAVYLHGRYQQYIGIDQSQELIAVARAFTADLPQASFLVANAKATTLPEKSADLLLSIGALHHMTDMDVVVQEMQRLGKPGANIAVIEPQNGNPFVQAMRWARARLDGSYSEEQIYFAPDDLLALLARNGVIDLQADFYGYVSTPFAQVVLNPQAITVPLSHLAVRADRWLEQYLPHTWRRLSFDIAVTGRLA